MNNDQRCPVVFPLCSIIHPPNTNTSNSLDKRSLTECECGGNQSKFLQIIPSSDSDNMETQLQKGLWCLSSF